MSLTFKNCTELTGELVIPNSVEYIGNSAFEGSSFNKIYIPIKHIDKYNQYWNNGLNAEIILY